MAMLHQKTLWLTDENLIKLRGLAGRLGQSEADIVRRAIKSYQPENEGLQSKGTETEPEATVMLDHIEPEFKDAYEVISRANRSIANTLSVLNDPIQRNRAKELARREIEAPPGWLDEIERLMIETNGAVC